MIRNYFKTALRNIIRQKTVAIINIICMAIAISCSLIAYLFTFDNLHSEWFHKNASNIFLVEDVVVEDGDLVTYGTSPNPLGPALLNDHSSIVQAVRITDRPVTIHTEASEFEEWIRFAEPAFFDMFTFPLAFGDPQSLKQKNAVILSRDAAIKYFGDENPIGKSLLIAFSARDKDLFTVTGVAARPLGPSSSLQFGILLNYENAFRANPDLLNDWNDFTFTFIQVDDPTRIGELSSQMQPYIDLQNKTIKSGLPIKRFEFQNLSELNTNRVNNSIAGDVSWAPIIVLSAIAIFLLLLACFNWMNVNIGSVGSRLKEIGIRKVIGGNKKQLVFQFLTENILVCFVSFIVAIALTGSLLLPAFEEIASTGIRMDFFSRVDIGLYLLLLFIGVSICSGLYPALYVSSFQPIAILRDRLQLSGKNNFTKALLTVQFVLAFITIISSVGLTLNYYDMQHRDWGYKKENLLTLQVANAEQYNRMKKLAAEQPDITNITGARKHIGFYQNNGFTVHSGDVKTNAIVFEVAPNYFEMMGFNMLRGKLPTANNEVLVNEKFAKRFGWTDGVEETITIDSVKYSITAIVKDFHHDHFMREIDPVVLSIGKEETFANLVMRVEKSKVDRIKMLLENEWKKYYSESTCLLAYQEESFNDMYDESRGIMRIFLFTTVVALLMSCIGLFGLATQRTQSKQKEICIRKIFGVPLARAVLLVNGNFLVLITIAAIIATPISYLLLNELLDSIYLFRMDIGVTPFVISYWLMTLTILVTLSEKIFQIAKSNPAHILRNE